MVQVMAGPPLPTRDRQRRGVLLPVLGLVAIAISGLLVLGLVAGEIGATAVVVGTLCALLPVGPVVAAFLWLDRWEPEPPRMLLLAFLWGACVATLTALLINSSAAAVLDQSLGRGAGDALGATLVAPVVEEAVKGAFLLGLLLRRRREFDGIIDGIVYAGLVAAGFAFTENILYIGRAFAEDAMAGQSGGVLAVLFLRGVLSPFAHPLFTVMIGIGAGVAATARTPGLRVAALLGGYVLAVALHALWNGSAAFFDGFVFLGVYLFVMVPLFLAIVAVALWQRRREQRTVAAALPGFAHAGWIAPSEVDLLATMAGRRGWRAAVRRRTGRDAARAVGDYQARVTELAFLRSRMERGRVGPAARYWHDELLAALVRARARALGIPQALTAAWRTPPPGWVPPQAGPPGAPNPSAGRGPSGGPIPPGGWGPPGGSPPPGRPPDPYGPRPPGR